jgi:hypothetical protein
MIPNRKSAISHINKHGVLLVYPVKNKLEIPSLWSCFYPRTKMRWEWTDDGDDKVAFIWHLRAELSDSKKVVYTKWFGGRATFISFSLFTALLSFVSQSDDPKGGLGEEARSILSVLEDDSPLPTKILRLECGLEGKYNEAKFNKGMRQLWAKLLIVGYGEVEEGGFPSLATGASKLLFEELWDESLKITIEERDKTIAKFIPANSPFTRHLSRWRDSQNKSLSYIATQSVKSISCMTINSEVK